MNAKLHVGDWLVDSALSEIRDGDRVVRLEQRSVAVLECLAEHPGELVDKARILQKVWPETFVSDEVLTHAIWELRKAFGDDAREPRFIQTIPKKGYRLIASVAQDHSSSPAMAAPILPAGTKDVPHPRRASRGMLAAAVALLAALGGFVFWRPATPPSPAPASACRLALLPFEDDAAGEVMGLADGITEDLARRLRALDSSLAQISRLAARDYLTSGISGIRQQLGAQYLLRGRLRRDDTTARLSVELSKLDDGTVVWSETFRLDLATPPMVEIAATVTTEVSKRLELGGSNVRARNAYLKGLELARSAVYKQETMEEAANNFNFAVTENPKFVAAWAELAKVEAKMNFNDEPSAKRRAAADAALRQAKRLAPDERETLIAEAFVEFHAHRKFREARDLFTRLAKEFPSDAEILRGLGYVERRLGDLPEATRYMEDAFQLERSAYLSSYIAETYNAQRRWPEAQKWFAIALEQNPDASDVSGEAALNLFDLTGSARMARDELAKFVHPRSADMLYYGLYLDLLAGDDYGAIDRNANWPSSAAKIDKICIPWLVATAARRLSRIDQADGLVTENRDYLRQCVADTPNDRYCQAYLALALAKLGDATEARTHMGQAWVLAADDRFSGPKVRELEAEMNVVLGEPANAVAILRELLGQQYQRAIGFARLRDDPVWAPLRTRQDFAELLRASAAAEDGNLSLLSVPRR